MDLRERGQWRSSGIGQVASGGLLKLHSVVMINRSNRVSKLVVLQCADPGPLANTFC